MKEGDWPSKPGKSASTDCPLCSKELKKSAMNGHMKFTHPKKYVDYYCVPCPNRFPCLVAGCTVTFARAYDRPDHLSRNHGIEDARHDPTDIKKLWRMPTETINRKFLAEAQPQNALKRRIAKAEGKLIVLLPEYSSAHGLSLVLWSESGRVEADDGAQAGLVDIRANRQPPKSGTVVSKYLAEKLRDVRNEVGKMGLRRDGSEGGYTEVAQELERLVALSGGSLDGQSEGDE